MSSTFIVPDVHGCIANLRALLEDAGLIEPHTGHRTPLGEETQIISLGDLANCVTTSRDIDLEVLDKVGTWIDHLLVGNHELPYFDGPGFGGYMFYHEIKEKLRELDKDGRILPAVAVGDVLVSHAGLTQHWGVQLGSLEAPLAAELIDALWLRDRHNPILCAVGYSRYGSYPQGGLFWSDYSEPKMQQFKQVIGHTPGQDVRQFGTTGSSAFPSYCIDLGATKGTMGGARIAGAFIEDNEITILEVELDSSGHKGTAETVD